MQVDSYGVGAIMILGTTLFSLVGLYLARRFTPIEKLKSCHEVGGYLLSVVGTMYAVLLGLVVVDAMTKFQTARNVVENEANSLADVFLLSERFPDEKRDKIRILCHGYTKEVIEVEFPLLAQSKISPTARKKAISLMKEIMDFEPTTENQKAIYPIAIQESCQLWDNRRARTNISGYGIPPIEWIVLIVGGVVTVVFTYFFGLESFPAQIAMTSMVSLLISLNLYLVALFGAPFSGDLRVGPDAFEVDQLIFENQLGSKLKPPDST